jgi:hypothetical protein
MLWESSKMEQRYDGVLGVIRDGFTVTEVAQKFGVSRQSVHSWMRRYEAGGLDDFAEQSSRPATSPTGARSGYRPRLHLRRVEALHGCWLRAPGEPLTHVRSPEMRDLRSVDFEQPPARGARAL